jgi:hypothetical protein
MMSTCCFCFFGYPHSVRSAEKSFCPRQLAENHGDNPRIAIIFSVRLVGVEFSYGTVDWQEGLGSVNTTLTGCEVDRT